MKQFINILRPRQNDNDYVCVSTFTLHTNPLKGYNKTMLSMAAAINVNSLKIPGKSGENNCITVAFNTSAAITKVAGKTLIFYAARLYPHSLY